MQMSTKYNIPSLYLHRILSLLLETIYFNFPFAPGHWKAPLTSSVIMASYEHPFSKPYSEYNSCLAGLTDFVRRIK